MNTAIKAFNENNGYITTFTQRELEAMFDYSYNSGLSPTNDVNWEYSSSINDSDLIIYYYLRKDLQSGAKKIDEFGGGDRRRLNQVNLFFFDYNFLDKANKELNPP